MSNKLKRIAIFQHCAPAASKMLDVSDAVYLCPICGQGYFEKSAISGELTLEDVPPKAIGGKGLLLTCRNCNSKAGHKIDYHIKNHYDLNKFNEIILGKTNNEKSRGDISIFGENYPVIVENTTNVTELGSGQADRLEISHMFSILPLKLKLY